MTQISLVHPNFGRRYVCRGGGTPELRGATELEIAWAAGLFEGEGSVIVENRPGKRQYATPRMQLSSTDQDVIERFRDVMGGRINFEPQKQANRKDQWRWVLQGYEAVILAAERFAPWLCERRTRQIRDVIARCDEVRAPLL